MSTSEATRSWDQNNPEKVRAIKRRSMKKARAADPEKHRAAARRSMKKWRENNPEKHREQQRAKYAADPESYRKRVRDWARDNPEKMAAHQLRYRSSKKVPEWLTSEDETRIKGIYVEARDRGLVVDHSDPLVPCACGRHGQHEPDNLQILTRSQNASKRNMCMPCWLSSGRPQAQAFVDV